VAALARLEDQRVMPGYYAYLIGVDGRFEKRVAIICDDDEEANASPNKW
jgi:hypothetical protein